MKSSPTADSALNDFASRLVTLPDGRSGLRASLRVQTSEPKVEVTGQNPGPEPAIIDFLASNERLDRYQEIISVQGWNLENYRLNPVFQNAHQYGDIIFTLGRALVTETREGALFQRIEFAVDVNPMARIAYGLYRGKFLNAVSVGFIPIRWETGDVHVGYERKFLEQELLEVSAVGISANPDALQLGLKAGAISRPDLEELFELLRTLCEKRGDSPSNFCGNPAAPNTTACASGVRSYEAQLLQLARAVQRTMRNA